MTFGSEAGRALLRYGRKPVVRRDDDVGVGREVKLVKRLAQLLEIFVGVPDGRARGRAIDARDQSV